MVDDTRTIYIPANWLDPLDWGQVFQVNRPIEVDIGCGKGAFLLWAANSNSQSNFIGIERQLVRLRRVDRKIQRMSLTNVRLLRVEAGYCINKLVPDDSITAYHVYFPDPWPKRRHHGRRLFQPDFVEGLRRTIRKTGIIHIATDDADYYTWIDSLMARIGGFRRMAAEQLPPEAMTEFERIFRDAGKTICRASYLPENQRSKTVSVERTS